MTAQFARTRGGHFCVLLSFVPKERIAKTKTRQAQADNSYEPFDREHEHVPPPMDFPKGISM